jgi:hypothetical protein
MKLCGKPVGKRRLLCLLTEDPSSGAKVAFQNWPIISWPPAHSVMAQDVTGYRRRVMPDDRRLHSSVLLDHILQLRYEDIIQLMQSASKCQLSESVVLDLRVIGCIDTDLW